MCGRVWQSITRAELKRLFDVDVQVPPLPRYNLAPTQPMLLVREQDGRQTVMARWGLLANVDQPKSLNTFNARIETVRTSPLFREAFASRRALVPITGLYEWAGEKTQRRPMALKRRDDKPLVCAGLWSELDGVPNCTVLTTTPLGIFSTVHDRMPLLLPQDRWDAWLDPESAPDLVWSLATLPHALHTAVHAYPVSPAVGNVRNEGVELTYPLD